LPPFSAELLRGITTPVTWLSKRPYVVVELLYYRHAADPSRTLISANCWRWAHVDFL